MKPTDVQYTTKGQNGAFFAIASVRNSHLCGALTSSHGFGLGFGVGGLFFVAAFALAPCEIVPVWGGGKMMSWPA